MTILGAVTCAALVACGSGIRSSSEAEGNRSTSVAAVHRVHVGPGGYLKDDGDDNKNPDDIAPSQGGPGDDDAPLFAEYGRPASRDVRRGIEALVRRYYRAAAAEDGLEACSLLTTGLVTALANSKGQSTSVGRRACGAALRTLFQQHHGQLLSDEVPTMVITDVHVRGTLGLVGLGFRSAPQSEILVQREGAWRVGALFDSELP